MTCRLRKLFGSRQPRRHFCQGFVYRLTNADGRTDEPILSETDFEDLNTGKDILYKLTFHIEDYYANEEVFFPKAGMRKA